MENEDVKQKILSEISKTEKLIEEYMEQTQPIEPDCSIGRVSRMDAINNKSVIETSLRQAESKLIGLKRVFSMYGTEDFGKCIKCKKQIPLGRVLFRPESLYCINCTR